MVGVIVPKSFYGVYFKINLLLTPIIPKIFSNWLVRL